MSSFKKKTATVVTIATLCRFFLVSSDVTGLSDNHRSLDTKCNDACLRLFQNNTSSAVSKLSIAMDEIQLVKLFDAATSRPLNSLLLSFKVFDQRVKSFKFKGPFKLL